MEQVIAATIIRREFKHELFMKVKKAMELANWADFVDGNRIILAPDFRNKRVIPGACTSPWVIESVIRILKEKNPDFDIILAHRNKEAIKSWGIESLVENLGVSIVDLNDEKREKYRGMLVPKIVLASNNIINLPVAGVNSQGFFGAMANLSGLVYQDLSHKKIFKLNKEIPADFTVIDATVCGESAHPFMAMPKIRDTVIAGSDTIAIDNSLCTLADVNQPEHVKQAEKKGMGTSNYKLIGSLRGEGMRQKSYPANRVARDIVAYFWYKFKGRKLTESIMQHPLYGEEFKALI